MHFLFIIISLIALLICNRANALTNYNDPSSQQHQNQHQLERRRSDHSGQFSGRGTWFEPGEGACGGAQANQGSMIVALNQEQYGNMNAVSRYCGRRIKISYAGKTVHAMIQDACPGCPFGALDMSPAVFNKLAAASVGVIQVTWQFTDGDDGGDSDKHVAAKHVVAKKEKAQHRTAKGHLKNPARERPSKSKSKAHSKLKPQRHSKPKHVACSRSKKQHHKKNHCKSQHHEHPRHKGHQHGRRQLANERDDFGARASDDYEDRRVDVTAGGLQSVEER